MQERKNAGADDLKSSSIVKFRRAILQQSSSIDEHSQGTKSATNT